MSPDVGQSHGNIMIGTFRKIYGEDFAKGFGPAAKLSTAMGTLDKSDKVKLQKDLESGILADKVRELAA